MACRRARSDEADEVVACVWSTPLNMTLYRSIFMLGISISSREAVSWGMGGTGGGDGGGAAAAAFSALLLAESPRRALNDILRPIPPDELDSFFTSFEGFLSMPVGLSFVSLPGDKGLRSVGVFKSAGIGGTSGSFGTGSVRDRMTMGVCFGVFLWSCAAPPEASDVVDTLGVSVMDR